MESRLPLVPQVVEKFISRWANRRIPPAKQQARINSRHLYILPTRHGIVFFIALLMVLIGAINYENNLGYMLAFLQSSFGFLAMVYTHQNLNHIELRLSNARPVFAGQNAQFPVTLSAANKDPHAALHLLVEDNPETTANLVKQQTTECNVLVKAPLRGYVHLPRIKVYSEFPMGLFYAWSWIKLDGKCLVYPSPAGDQALMNSRAAHKKGNISSDKTGVDDFAGIREYQTGDSPGHMAWKAIARTGTLQTKVYNTETSSQLSIDWFQLDSRLDTEQRLSILCRMILDADDQGLAYTLILPDFKVDSGSGLQHKQQCLKALALFGKHT